MYKKCNDMSIPKKAHDLFSQYIVIQYDMVFHTASYQQK